MDQINTSILQIKQLRLREAKEIQPAHMGATVLPSSVPVTIWVFKMRKYIVYHHPVGMQPCTQGPGGFQDFILFLFLYAYVCVCWCMCAHMCAGVSGDQKRDSDSLA